jgi:hypothetical protein
MSQATLDVLGATHPQQPTDTNHATAPPCALQNSDSPQTTGAEKWKAFFSSQTKQGATASMYSRPVVLSAANSRTNAQWGDVLQQKHPSHTRVYAINLNGISLDRRGGQFDDVCRSLRETQVDVFCGQEHNLDTTQAHLRSIIFTTANQHWDRNRICMGTSPITVHTPYKPGGTIMMTVGSLTGRIFKQERDKWGRWTCQLFQGKATRRLVIISAYQPIVKGPIAGKITVAAQHRSLLTLANESNNNPRTAFRKDLHDCLRQYQDQDTDILLLGDFNEVLGSDPDGMSKLAITFGLMDLMASRHSSAPPATYARGSKRLDYALASPTICKALRASGYEEFNSRISSDHRGYYFDFDTQQLFGSDTQQLVSHTKRKFSTANVNQVTAYIRRKHQLLTDSNAFGRGTKLLTQGNRHAFAERLDQDVLRASLTAELDLPVFGAPVWSQDLVVARKKVSILQKQLSAIRTGLEYRSRNSDTHMYWEPPLVVPNTYKECSSLLRTAKLEVRDIVSQSFERRDNERRQRLQGLDASANAHDKATAVRLRKIQKAEDLNQLFRKLRAAQISGIRQGVTRVEIPKHSEEDPKTCTEWIQIDVPTDVLRLLQERNRAHFGQAHGTPFTVPPLSEHLGFRGDGTYGQQILSGKYDMSECKEDVQLLLQHLKQVDEVHQLPSRPTILPEEFESKLKIWTESTTTSPSGLHLGHFKALIARHSFHSTASDDELTPAFREQRDELNRKQADLFDLHLSLINYALERGYSYKRWQTIANTILFKDPDNVRLHRTRVIHIYEADFNLALGVKWRAAMHQAEDLHLLNEGQYGSRPQRNATDPVFIEELQYEISRATRKPVILTNYDATACYDRIVPNLGMLVSQKYGVAPTVTTTNAATLEYAEYRIRTELGLADTGYTHTPTAPIYGTGQGSANSPAIWCFLSSSLFDCYDKKAHQAEYVDPSQTVAVDVSMIGFVDDCNGQTNQFYDDGSERVVAQLVQQAQYNAQVWNNLLAVSGGALELSKTSCHVLQWLFSANGAPVLAPYTEAHQPQLTVHNDQTHTTHNLQVLSSYKAHKTLGHFKDPAGTQLEQYRQLTRKSDKITAFLWKCPLSRREAWTYYYACYLPSVSYPLSCSALSKRQLDKVQRKAMAIITARCGFNRNTRKEILYGPLDLGGANFRHLYVEQGVGQVTLFLRHWRKNSVSGRLLRIAVAWFQSQTGVSYSILEKVHTDLPHLESKWLKSLRAFLHSIQSSLCLDEPAIPALQRLYDHHIMDAILASHRFTPAEIRRLNYCRLFLQATTLSDLAHVKGTRLDHSKLLGCPSMYSSTSGGPQIYQQRPAEPEWKLWKKANLIWSTPEGIMVEPLGPWLDISSHQRQHHQAYWNQPQHTPEIELWVRAGSGYTRCLLIHDGTFRETTLQRDWKNLPPDMHPVEAHFTGQGRWNFRSDGCRRTPPPLYVAATFEQFIQSLPPWEEELLSLIEMTADPFTVSEALSHGVCAVSDGSVWDNFQGAYGWTISTDLGERCVEGMGPVRGAHPDSFRAEAYGMLTTLCYLSRLAEYTGVVETWSGVLATDSQSLLDAISYKPKTDSVPVMARTERRLKDIHTIDVLSPEWDLVSNILSILKTFPGLYLQYVRGHQDKKVAYAQLPLLAQLNVDADAMATRYQRQHTQAYTQVLLTATAGVHLLTPQGSITSRYTTEIRYQATHGPLLSYLQHRHGWTDQITKAINWKAHGTALRARLNERTHFVKLVQGVLPTSNHVHRRDPIRSLCPACGLVPEDWTHILRCHHSSRSQWRASLLASLKGELITLQTRPLLVQILMAAISGWLECNHEQFTFDPTPYPHAFRRAIQQQNSIGWQHVFQGRFSHEWSDIQDGFYASHHDHTGTPQRRTGQRWQVAVIGVLWKQWKVLWASRNQDLHGTTAMQQCRALSRALQRDLRDVYDLKDQLEPSVRALLLTDLETHLQKPTWVNRMWLDIHAPIVTASVKRAREKAIQGTKSIRHYFPIQ